MIHRQIRGSTAVLAAVSVTAKDILPRQDNFFERNPDKENKPHHAGIFEFPVNGFYNFRFDLIQDFCFAEIGENKCPPDIADSEGFVVLVKY